MEELNALSWLIIISATIGILGMWAWCIVESLFNDNYQPPTL